MTVRQALGHHLPSVLIPIVLEYGDIQLVYIKEFSHKELRQSCPIQGILADQCGYYLLGNGGIMCFTHDHRQVDFIALEDSLLAICIVSGVACLFSPPGPPCIKRTVLTPGGRFSPIEQKWSSMYVKMVFKETPLDFSVCILEILPRLATGDSFRLGFSSHERIAIRGNYVFTMDAQYFRRYSLTGSGQPEIETPYQSKYTFSQLLADDSFVYEVNCYDSATVHVLSYTGELLQLLDIPQRLNSLVVASNGRFYGHTSDWKVVVYETRPIMCM